MKSFRSILLCAGFFLFSATPLFAQNPPQKDLDFNTQIGENFELFATANAETFLERASKNALYPLFRWTDEKKTSARYPGYANSPKLLLFEIIPLEVICHFSEGKLSSLYFSLYNCGDAGKISPRDFEAKVNDLTKKIDAKTGESSSFRKERIGPLNYTSQRVWIKENFVYDLRWNFAQEKAKSPIEPEYIQLEIAPFNPKQDPRKIPLLGGDARSRLKNSIGLPKNVRKEDDGSVWIDGIPMVDQGQKGYCVAAVVERVLRYYGNEQVTQHLIAQVADSDADRGTSLDALTGALKKIGAKMNIKVREKHQTFDKMKDVERFFSQYNKVAKKEKQPAVEPVVRGNTIYLGESIAKMNPKTLHVMRNADGAGKRKFLAAIRESVKNGIPLEWSVWLGLVEEEKTGNQLTGGHMRLILGYNDKEQVLFFSDTWGLGHEKKRMSYDDAWAITNALLLIEPRK